MRQIIESNRSMKILRRRISIGKREILKLQDRNGKITSSNKQNIPEIVKDYYKELYKNKQDKNNNSDSLTIIKNKLINEYLPEIIANEIKKCAERNEK